MPARFELSLLSSLSSAGDPPSCQDEQGAPCELSTDDLSMVLGNDDITCTGSRDEPIRKTKHVCFADDCGKQLVQYRYVENCLLRDAGSEGLPTPVACHTLTFALQRFKLLRCALAKQHRGETFHRQETAAQVGELVRKLNRDSIGVERVGTTKGSLSGRLRVRNISYRKRVFIRLSTDSWKSYADVEATYVQDCAMSPTVLAPFDPFDFHVDLDVDGAVQFAACYEDGQWSSVLGQ